MALCIKNARIVDALGIAPGAVLVADDGRIAAVTSSSGAAADIAIDARGKLLFPGFIDAHVHMRDPGQPQKEDFGSGSIAAAIGGVTTVMCMPNTRPAIDTVDGFHQARAAGERASHVDFALQAAVHPANHDKLRDLWNVGVVSFETMLADGPSGEAYVEREALLEMLALIAELDALVGVYPGSQPIIDSALARLRAEGRNDFPAFAESRPAESEGAGLRMLVEAFTQTRARVVARQTSTVQGFKLLAEAKAQAPKDRIFVEVTPHHLHIDASALERFGPFAQMLPPLRSQADIAAARAALAAGTVDFIGSDHAPHAVEEKDKPDPWSCPSGTPGLDTIVPALLELAAQGVITYPQAAERLAARPAEAFGLAPRKGRIAAGADGDFALVDPDEIVTVSQATIHSRAARSPFEGMTLRGKPVLTVLRGQVICENGLMNGSAVGRFVARNNA